VGVTPQRGWRRRREDNLRGLRTTGVVRTTASQQAGVGSPQLLPEVAVTGLDQRWGAASTAVRVPQALVALAVRLAASRRRGLGWALDRDLEAARARAALRRGWGSTPIGAGPRPRRRIPAGSGHMEAGSAGAAPAPPTTRPTRKALARRCRLRPSSCSKTPASLRRVGALAISARRGLTPHDATLRWGTARQPRLRGGLDQDSVPNWLSHNWGSL
jgi:hypothetical protein